MKNKRYELLKLSNGLTLITESIPYVNSVAVYVAVGAGPRYETAETAGLAHFLEHMLFEGTKKWPSSKEVAEFIERVGGRTGAWTDKEYVIYSVKIQKQHLELGLQFLSEILFNSLLAPKAIAKEKKIVVEELYRKVDHPVSEAWDRWFEYTWGKNQPLGRSIIGYIPTIKAVNQTKLARYLNHFYHPANMVIAIVGNFKPKIAKKLMGNYFSISHQKSPLLIPKARFIPKEVPLKITKANTKQCQLIAATITNISLTDHDRRYPITLLAEILGGSVGARLFHKLVYETNLAYTLETANYFFSDTGFFYIQGGFQAKNLAKSLKIIISELQRLKSTKITLSELRMAKERAKAKLTFDYETPDYLANLYVTQQLLEKKITPPEKMIEKIECVTANDIQEIAKLYLTGKNLSLLIRGPMDHKISKQLESILEKLSE